MNKLNDKDSDVHKILTTTKKGIEAARKVAKTYNKFAGWLGLPQVPKFLL